VHNVLSKEPRFCILKLLFFIRWIYNKAYIHINSYSIREIVEVLYLVKRPFKKFKSEAPPGEPEKYIDLGEMYSEGVDIAGFPAKMNVRVAELHRYEDLGELTSQVYDGNILILDFTPIANDNLALRRVTNELRSVTKDVGGDLAGVSKNLLVITPEGVRIDRTKIKGPY
jgi:SepF-like predicted cell division protein (DUF552 family)